MTNRLMMSVAAVALIAGTGFASAQGTMGREGSSAGSTAQQSAPSAGTSGREAAEPTKPSSGMKSTQSEQKSPAAGKNERAEDNLQGQKSKSMSSDNDRTKGGKDMKAEGREDRGKDMKAEGREDRNGMKAEGREDRNGMKAEGREDRNMKAETKGSETRTQTTTGQAGAGAKLSTEQRTKITSVIREQHVAPVNNVNFSISVGTRVPREVSFHPLQAQIVTIYPEWRGYEFFLVRDQIVVVDPRTLEIVAVLEA